MSNNFFKKIISRILSSVLIAGALSMVFSPLRVNHAFATHDTALKIMTNTTTGANSGINPNLINPLLPIKALSTQDNAKFNNARAENAGQAEQRSILGGSRSDKVPVHQPAYNEKEEIKDSIWTLMAKRAIRQITTSIVDWINSGFDGNPAFITDLGGFLTELADRETALFIEGTPLELLCSPWKLQIQIALSAPTRYRERIACTLSDIVANMDDFINGDFAQGGWAGWFELTTRPNNNPYGIYLSAASELDSRIASRQNEKITLLNWGNGFLSKEECEETPLKDGETGPGRPRNCKIVTPGSVIESQLANVLGSGVRQLELADEFNEIVNALIAQLVTRTFTDIRGLRGLSGSSSYGGASYTAQIFNAEDNVAIRNIIYSLSIEFNTVINEEFVYLDTKQNTFDAMNNSESRLSDLIACYNGKLADRYNLQLSNSEISAALDRIDSASSTIQTLIAPRKNILSSEINFQKQLILTLDSLLNDVKNAENPSQLQKYENEFLEMRDGNVFHGPYIFLAAQENAAILSEMSALDQDTQNKINECGEFPQNMRPVFNP